MKKLIGIAIAGSLLCGPAMAQQLDPTSALGALLSAQGPVQGLTTTLTTANPLPLINGLVGPGGFVQGDIAAPLNSSLTGLLVNQDPTQVSNGLQSTLTVTLDALTGSVLGTTDPAQLPDAIAALAGNGGLPALPGADALPVDLLSGGVPSLDSLPSLPGLDGTGGTGLSPDQLGQLTALLGG